MKNISLISILIITLLFIFNFNKNVSSMVFSNQTIISQTADSIEAATDSYCIVSKEKIEDGGVKFKYLNTNVTFCCTGCEKKFKLNPAKYLESGIEDPVCGMSEVSKDITSVNDSVTYYFCGKGCKKAFEKDQTKYLYKYSK